MKCHLCGKQTQHPNQTYCRKCKKKVRNIHHPTSEELVMMRLEYLQEAQKKYDDELLKMKLEKKNERI